MYSNVALLEILTCRAQRCHIVDFDGKKCNAFGMVVPSATCSDFRPPNQMKQCDGPCGWLKPQSEYGARQWRKPGGEGECVCLDCSHPQMKQCNGPCGWSKPTAEYSARQWRKPGREGARKKGGRLCLDCSCSSHAKNVIEL